MNTFAESHQLRFSLNAIKKGIYSDGEKTPPEKLEYMYYTENYYLAN